MRSATLVCSLLVAALSLLELSRAQFVTIPAGVAAAGLATAAAAAVGLGALGVGAAVLRGGGRRGGGGFRRGRFHRGRRSAELEEEEQVWEEVSAQDPARCFQKLVCLLEAAEDKLNDNEKKMVKFVGDLGRAELAVFSKLPYEAAGWLGKFRGQRACEAAFGDTCTYDRQQMMAFIGRLWSQPQPRPRPDQTA